MFAVIEQARKDALSNAETSLADVFKEFFQRHEGMKKVLFIGYTPSFNDGEPCLNSSDVANGLYSRQIRDDSYRIICDDYSHYKKYKQFFDLVVTEEGGIVSFANDQFKGDVAAMNTDLETIIQVIDMLYATNYEVKVSLRDDGSVELIHEEYDCGY